MYIDILLPFYSVVSKNHCFSFIVQFESSLLNTIAIKTWKHLLHFYSRWKQTGFFLPFTLAVINDKFITGLLLSVRGQWSNRSRKKPFISKPFYWNCSMFRAIHKKLCSLFLKVSMIVSTKKAIISQAILVA